MTNDVLVVLLPKALFLDDRNVGVRPWPLRLYCNRQNGYRLIQIDKVSYEPSWALASMAVAVAGVEQEHFSGGSGQIDVSVSADDSNPTDLILFNKSIDSQCQFTIRMRAWAEGEG